MVKGCKGVFWPRWLKGHVWPAQQLNVKESIDQGLEEDRSREGKGKAVFFLRVPFVWYLLLCAHPERKDGHSAPVSSAQMDAQCHSLLLTEGQEV